MMTSSIQREIHGRDAESAEEEIEYLRCLCGLPVSAVNGINWY